MGTNRLLGARQSGSSVPAVDETHLGIQDYQNIGP